MPISKGFDLKKFSENLYGLSGAEISFIAKEAAYNCLRRVIDLKELLNSNDNIQINYENIIIQEQDFYSSLKKVKAKNRNINDLIYIKQTFKR